jgi:hypothetical protein
LEKHPIDDNLSGLARAKYLRRGRPPNLPYIIHFSYLSPMKNDLLRRNERYNQLINNLFAEMEPHSHEALNRRPADGGWSAIQTMHHLILSEEASMAYIKKKLGFNPEFEKAGIGARLRSLLLWLSLRSPFKFKAPTVVGDAKLPDQASLADTRERWQKIRAEWGIFLAQMDDNLVDKAVYKHARAGKLSWQQMMAFYETHFERHLQQIRNALRA